MANKTIILFDLSISIKMNMIRQINNRIDIKHYTLLSHKILKFKRQVSLTWHINLLRKAFSSYLTINHSYCFNDEIEQRIE